MNNIVVAVVVSLFFVPLHTMKEHIKESSEGGYEISKITPEIVEKYLFLQKPTMTEWAKDVKEKNKTHEIENHLIDLAKQYFFLSKNIEIQCLDEAYISFKKVNTLRKQAAKCKDDVLRQLLNDTYCQQLDPEHDQFVHKFSQELQLIFEKDNIKEPLLLNSQNREIVRRKAWNQCVEELNKETEIRFSKVVLAGAELSGCNTQEWMNKITEQITGKKVELKKNDCKIM